MLSFARSLRWLPPASSTSRRTLLHCSGLGRLPEQLGCGRVWLRSSTFLNLRPTPLISRGYLRFAGQFAQECLVRVVKRGAVGSSSLGWGSGATVVSCRRTTPQVKRGSITMLRSARTHSWICSSWSRWCPPSPSGISCLSPWNGCSLWRSLTTAGMRSLSWQRYCQFGVHGSKESGCGAILPWYPCSQPGFAGVRQALGRAGPFGAGWGHWTCLLYTSDAADEHRDVGRWGVGGGV